MHGLKNPNDSESALFPFLFEKRRASERRTDVTLRVAVYHLKVGFGSRASGQSACAKNEYIEREGRYASMTARNASMSSTATCPRGRRTTRTPTGRRRTRMSAPTGVSTARSSSPCRANWTPSGRRALAGAFAERVCGGERLPYTLALHKGAAETPDKPDNPHAHLMFSERGNDGVARSEEQWFKRHNPTAPAQWRGAQEPGGQGRGLAGQDPPDVGADGESGAGAGGTGRTDRRPQPAPIGATRPTARATLSGRPS